jgi:hypothetical protein
MVKVVLMEAGQIIMDPAGSRSKSVSYLDIFVITDKNALSYWQ